MSVSESVSSRRSTLFALCELVRLPNVFTAWADIAMGFLMTHAVLVAEQAWSFVSLVIASSCFYSAGMVLNDLFDFEIDSRDRPNRPLPSGRISRTAARAIGWGLLAAGMTTAWLITLFIGDVRPGVIGTLLACTIVAYDGLLKRTPLGPLAMGACRMANVLLGMSVSVASWQPVHWLVAVAIGTYITGVTWFARTEAHESRRWHLLAATGVLLSGVGLLAYFPCLLEGVYQSLQTRARLLLAMLGFFVGFRCLTAVIDPIPRMVQHAVRVCIFSLITLDAAVCLVVHGPFWAMIVLLLLAPVVVLGRWFHST